MAPANTTGAMQEQVSEIDGQDAQLATTNSPTLNGANGGPKDASETENHEARYSPLFVPEGSPLVPGISTHEVANLEGGGNAGIAILVPPVERRWEYCSYIEAPVEKILEEYDDGEDLRYLVKLSDGCKQKVSEVLPDNELGVTCQRSEIHPRRISRSPSPHSISMAKVRYLST